MSLTDGKRIAIPLFGARRIAREMAAEVQELRSQIDVATSKLVELKLSSNVEREAMTSEVQTLRGERDALKVRLKELGALDVIEREALVQQLDQQIAGQRQRLEQEQVDASRSLNETLRHAPNSKSASTMCVGAPL